GLVAVTDAVNLDIRGLFAALELVIKGDFNRAAAKVDDIAAAVLDEQDVLIVVFFLEVELDIGLVTCVVNLSQCTIIEGYSALIGGQLEAGILVRDLIERAARYGDGGIINRLGSLNIEFDVSLVILLALCFLLVCIKCIGQSRRLVGYRCTVVLDCRGIFDYC